MNNIDYYVAKKMQNASFYEMPFRHWIIESLLPENLVQEVELEVASIPNELWNSFNYEMQQKSQLSNINLMPKLTRDLITYLNSGTFLEKIEQLTGIKNLISDPYLEGGGLHRIKKGGRLAIHADFSRHNKLKIYRRINIILYLNNKWKDEYNGKLSLYDNNAVTIRKSISPELNRAVIFETNIDSFHGHPEPIECPDNISRKSIALYYYTTEKSDMVRGINTRWRNGDSRVPRLKNLRKYLSILIWKLSKLFDIVSDKLERLHTKIDIN